MRKARVELSDAMQLAVVVEVKFHLVSRHAVTSRSANRCFEYVRDTRGSRPGLHRFRARCDGGGENYISLPCRNQSPESLVTRGRAGVGAKLDIYLLVPRADLESSKFEELRQFGMLVDATAYWP